MQQPHQRIQNPSEDHFLSRNKRQIVETFPAQVSGSVKDSLESKNKILDHIDFLIHRSVREMAINSGRKLKQTQDINSSKQLQSESSIRTFRINRPQPIVPIATEENRDIRQKYTINFNSPVRQRSPITIQHHLGPGQSLTRVPQLSANNFKTRRLDTNPSHLKLPGTFFSQNNRILSPKLVNNLGKDSTSLPKVLSFYDGFKRRQYKWVLSTNGKSNESDIDDIDDENSQESIERSGHSIPTKKNAISRLNYARSLREEKMNKIKESNSISQSNTDIPPLISISLLEQAVRASLTSLEPDSSEEDTDSKEYESPLDRSFIKSSQLVSNLSKTKSNSQTTTILKPSPVIQLLTPIILPSLPILRDSSSESQILKDNVTKKNQPKLNESNEIGQTLTLISPDVKRLLDIISFPSLPLKEDTLSNSEKSKDSLETPINQSKTNTVKRIQKPQQNNPLSISKSLTSKQLPSSSKQFSSNSNSFGLKFDLPSTTPLTFDIFPDSDETRRAPMTTDVATEVRSDDIVDMTEPTNKDRTELRQNINVHEVIAKSFAEQSNFANDQSVHSTGISIGKLTSRTQSIQPIIEKKKNRTCISTIPHSFLTTDAPMFLSILEQIQIYQVKPKSNDTSDEDFSFEIVRANSTPISSSDENTNMISNSGKEIMREVDAEDILDMTSEPEDDNQPSSDQEDNEGIFITDLFTDIQGNSGETASILKILKGEKSTSNINIAKNLNAQLPTTQIEIKKIKMITPKGSLTLPTTVRKVIPKKAKDIATSKSSLTLPTTERKVIPKKAEDIATPEGSPTLLKAEGTVIPTKAKDIATTIIFPILPSTASTVTPKITKGNNSISRIFTLVARSAAARVLAAAEASMASDRQETS